MAWITQPLASYLFRRLPLRRQVPEELEAPRTRTMAKSARGQCHLFGPSAGDLAFASTDCPRRTTENYGPKEADETPHGGHDLPSREVNRPLEATSSHRHWRPRETQPCRRLRSAPSRPSRGSSRRRSGRPVRTDACPPRGPARRRPRASRAPAATSSRGRARARTPADPDSQKPTSAPGRGRR
jgi:hypothetical protein